MGLSGKTVVIFEPQFPHLYDGGNSEIWIQSEGQMRSNVLQQPGVRCRVHRPLSCASVQYLLFSSLVGMVITLYPLGFYSPQSALSCGSSFSFSAFFFGFKWLPCSGRWLGRRGTDILKSFISPRLHAHLTLFNYLNNPLRLGLLFPFSDGKLGFGEVR